MDIIFHGIVFTNAAICEFCSGHLKIWPASALAAHIKLRHGEQVKKRRGRGGRAFGTRNRKSMCGTGVEFKDVIHAA